MNMCLLAEHHSIVFRIRALFDHLFSVDRYPVRFAFPNVIVFTLARRRRDTEKR
jgi:hypothetical protein